MRIIAGTHGSRRYEAPTGMDTRPTLDKVKEAVFSSLGGFFDGGAVLDLYAGSGGIGYEALSRGKDTAVFVDMSRKAVQVIRSNLKTLGLADRAEVLPVKAEKAIRLLHEEGKTFDLVYLDPPYKLQENESVMRQLLEYELMEDGAVGVIESLKEEVYPEAIGSWKKTREAVYGITRISYYNWEKE
ncbi:MAG: 16S rRNA (guanine(966)-N(2))-methyltransferase RsmD [Solobacterium sp.]|nr:16S rRNA (guanine(966)-N(2))-methyltransferase RsmD [Solobacterium sp.]